LRDNYAIYARFDKLYASRINLHIKPSTHLQDHIQGGRKKLAHFVLYALTLWNIDRFSDVQTYFTVRIRRTFV